VPSKVSILNPFADANPMMELETKRMQGNPWIVKRYLKDFEALRYYLLERHPDCIVPALPKLKKNKDVSDLKYSQSLGKLCCEFLQQCMNTPSLRSDKFLSRFVTDELPVAHFSA
jgi:hypothetical protein